MLKGKQLVSVLGEVALGVEPDATLLSMLGGRLLGDPAQGHGQRAHGPPGPPGTPRAPGSAPGRAPAARVGGLPSGLEARPARTSLDGHHSGPRGDSGGTRLTNRGERRW